MFRISVPANANTLIKNLLPITQFDFLEPWWTDLLVKTFGIDEDKYELFEINGYLVTDQFKEMGYEVTMCILLLGSVGFFFMIYLLKVVALGFAYTFYRIKGKGVCYRWYKKLQKMVFFNNLIALCRESYIDLLIVGYFTVSFYGP